MCPGAASDTAMALARPARVSAKSRGLVGAHM